MPLLSSFIWYFWKSDSFLYNVLFIMYVYMDYMYRILYTLLATAKLFEKYVVRSLNITRGEKFYYFFFFEIAPLLIFSSQNRKIRSRSAYDLMASKHLRFTRRFPWWFHRSMHHMLHFRTLRIMLADPNVIRCSSCNAAHWYRKSGFRFSLMYWSRAGKII